MNGLKASADTQQQHKDLVLSQEVALVLQPFYLIPQCTSLQHKFSWVEMSLKALLPGTHFCSVLKSVTFCHIHLLLIIWGFVGCRIAPNLKWPKPGHVFLAYLCLTTHRALGRAMQSDTIPSGITSLSDLEER